MKNFEENATTIVWFFSRNLWMFVSEYVTPLTPPSVKVKGTAKIKLFIMIIAANKYSWNLKEILITENSLWRFYNIHIKWVS